MVVSGYPYAPLPLVQVHSGESFGELAILGFVKRRSAVVRAKARGLKGPSVSLVRTVQILLKDG